MDLSSIHPTISSLTASTMAKLSHNINKMRQKNLVFNSDSEEQCTSNVSDIERSENIVATNEAWHDRKSKNRDTVIQFNISDSALNYVV
jgi:hypothetical protein